MKKMQTQPGPSLMITPCYDGHLLRGVQKVAKDGLSVISIKQTHKNCQFMIDPNTKLPCISCAQGIKARNSYWNLHVPDLRKVRGLECATTESVTHLLRAHNTDNAGKPKTKRKILRLLESLRSKKQKSQTSDCEVLKERVTWPVNRCVLSSICQETEIKQNGGIGTQDLFSFSELPSQQNKSKEQIIEKCNPLQEKLTIESRDYFQQNVDKEFSFSSLTCTPCTSGCGSMKTDLLSEESEKFHHSLEQLIAKTEPELETSRESEQFSFSLEFRESLTKISISSQLLCTPDIKNNKIYARKEVVSKSVICIKKNIQKQDHDRKNVIEQSTDSELKYSSVIVHTATEEPILNEMYKEMKEIEDYISLHISTMSGPEEGTDYPQTSGGKNTVHMCTDLVGSISNCATLDGLKPNVEVKADLNCFENKISGNLVYFNEAMEKKKEQAVNLINALSEDPLLGFCSWECSSEDTECASSLNESKLPLTTPTITEGKENHRMENSRKEEHKNGYCYWVTSSFEAEEIATTNNFCKSNSFETRKNFTSLVPVDFIENVWKECVEGYNLLDEENEVHSLLEDTELPRQFPWISMYDENSLEEAHILVNTAVDLFLNDNLHFGPKTTFKRTYCTITEIEDDEDQFSTTKDQTFQTQSVVDKELAKISVVGEGTTQKSSKILPRALSNDRNLEAEAEPTEFATQDNKLRSDRDNSKSSKMINDQNGRIQIVEESLSSPLSKHILNIIKNDSQKYSETYIDLDKLEVKSSNESLSKTVKKEFMKGGLLRESTRKISRFVHANKQHSEISQTSPQTLAFSSSKLQLNLTNPLQK